MKAIRFFQLVISIVITNIFIVVIFISNTSNTSAQVEEPTPTPEFEVSPQPSIESEFFPSLTTEASIRGYDPQDFFASFYDLENLGGYLFTKSYSKPIDFLVECFDENYPYSGCKLIPELSDGWYYSVRWQGNLIIPFDGIYTFSFNNVDDGVRLFIDGHHIADQGWLYPFPDIMKPPRNLFLSAGNHNFVIDYEQRPYYRASLQALWSGPGFGVEIIPVAGSGQSLEDKAIELARSVLNAKYLWGGKGYNWSSGPWVHENQIKSGYYYCDYDENTEKCVTRFDRGLDCSGLVMWSFNKAFGASKYQAQGNPVYYENADGQYKFNTVKINESDRRPGDLLFFFNGEKISHVAMYIGGNEVIEASSTNGKVVISSLSARLNDPTYHSMGRLSEPRFDGQVRAYSPVNLVVTDPDKYSISAATLSITESEIAREIPGVLYYSEWDIDGDGDSDDLITIPILKVGRYVIEVYPELGASESDLFSLEFEAKGTILSLANDTPISEIPDLGYGILVTEDHIDQYRPVSIDIKPGSNPNSINCNNANDVISVAILTTDDFDATTVNHMGVNFEGATEIHKSRNSGELQRHEEDVDFDGDLDLVFHFFLRDTNLSCESTEGKLNGLTYDNVYFIGVDDLRMVDN